MRLVERMTLKSANVDHGQTLFDMATSALGAWGGMDYSETPDHEGFSQVTFDRNGTNIHKAGKALSAFGDDWQIVLTYWKLDDR